VEQRIPSKLNTGSRLRSFAGVSDNLCREISRIIGMAGRLLETDLSAEQRTLVEAMRCSVDALFTTAYAAEEIPIARSVDEDDETRPARASVRALVVDDQSVARKILSRCLDAINIRADSAATAPDALKMLRGAAANGAPYRLAFIDFRMTGFTGLDLAQAIAASPALGDTKVILVSAYERADIGDDAIQRCCAAFVQKPIQASSVRQAIEAALKTT
jgi:CheY-like chemotaxis protein